MCVMFDGVVVVWDDVVCVMLVVIVMLCGLMWFLFVFVFVLVIGFGFLVFDCVFCVVGVECDDVCVCVRLVYVLVMGMMLSVVVFGCVMVVCVYFGVCAYVMMLATRRRCGYVVFAGLFVYLMWYYFVVDMVMVWKSGEVDISGLLMVLVLKVMVCALNY